MTELFAGATSYWLVLAKSGGGGAGAAGGTCCPGSDGGAASRAVFLGPGDLALAARTVRRCRGRGRSGGLATPDGKICARCIPKQLFAGLFGCMARISCQSQLISDAWRANLAANWRFSRPKPPRRCMRRKNCHGLPPGNAPWRNLAADRRSGTHRGGILPLPVARKRIREDLAMDERLDSPRTK